jgi:hypothetical protein
MKAARPGGASQGRQSVRPPEETDVMFERDQDEDDQRSDAADIVRRGLIEKDLIDDEDTHGNVSMPLRHNHGEIVEAIKRHELGQKEIAYLIVERLGPPSHDTTNDGSIATLAAISAELAEDGIDYSVDLLRKLRKFGAVFPRDVEAKELPWTLQLAAGSPERLQEVLAFIGNKKPTYRRIVEARRAIEDLENPRPVQCTPECADLIGVLVTFDQLAEEVYRSAGYELIEGHRPHPDNERLEGAELIAFSQELIDSGDYGRIVKLYHQVWIGAEKILGRQDGAVTAAKEAFEAAYANWLKRQPKPEPQPPKPGGLRRI